MTLKAPLNPWHMVPNSMEVFVAKKWSDPLLQLGFYKDQWLAAAWESVEDVYSNGTIKKTKDWDKVTVNISVHELTVEKLEILQSGLVEVHAGTVSDEVETWMPWEWSFNRDLLLKYSNGDGSVISSPEVKALINGTEETLVADTDYTVWVNNFGATYVQLLMKDDENTSRKLDVDSPEKVKVSITYSSTNATAKVMDHKANAMADSFVMVLKNEFEFQWEKKSITTYIDNCQASKAMLQQIADSDNTTVGFPVEITGHIVKQDFVGFSMNA